MTTRMRADRLLVARGLFETRARAQSAIDAGVVTADGAPVRRASDLLPTTAVLEGAPEHPYVSRGGVKLAAALDHFGFDPRDAVCLDVGSSTGGFSDVLLRRGARRVVAVDVGTEQMHPRLRGDARLCVLEGTDIRALQPDAIGEAAQGVVVDVSFISLRHVLPALTPFLARAAWLVALIKPQFEAGRAQAKKGVVRNAAVHAAVCEDLAAFAAGLGWRVEGVIASPIPGKDGNREFLLGARRDA